MRAIPAAWENRYTVCRKATGQLPSVIRGAGFICKPRGQVTDMQIVVRRVIPTLLFPGLGKGGFWVINTREKVFPYKGLGNVGRL